MRKSQLIKIRDGIDLLNEQEIKEILLNLIDVIVGEPVEKKADVPKIARRRKKRKSTSKDLKKNRKLWPRILRKKYIDAVVTIRRGHAYAQFIDDFTGEYVQIPVTHLVWEEVIGIRPYKGKRIRHIDGDILNNKYRNLHPEDGVYE